MTEKLLRKSDLCEYFGVSVRTLDTRIVCRPDFPDAIKVPGSLKRWVESEVHEWALAQRENQRAA